MQVNQKIPIKPEDQLILACLQQQPTLPKVEFDEAYLIHRLAYHNVTSIVYQHLLKIDSLKILSVETQAKLKEHYHLNIIYNLAISGLVKQISSTFKANNIKLTTLKGARLIQSFPDYALVREMCDLDILVEAKNLELALDLFSKVGFNGSVYLQQLQNQRRKWYLINLGNAIVLESTRVDIPNIIVELHHRLFSIRNTTYWSEEDLWRRAQYCSEQGVYHLDSIDALLHLCAHQCSDLRIYLYGLVDIAYILKYENDKIDWIEAISRAKSRKVLLHLVNILRLGHELLNSPLPAIYSECLKPYERQAEPGYYLLLERLFSKEKDERVFDIQEEISISRVFRRLENYTFWQRIWYETTSLIPTDISLRLSYYMSKLKYWKN